MNEKEIKSLLFLLDDPDPYVQKSVEGRLHELGEEAVPMLDEHKEILEGDAGIERLNRIIRSITFDNLQQDFYDYLTEGVDDMERLEEAVWMLVRFQEPTFRAQPYKEKLDRMARSISEDVQYSLDDRKKMRRLLSFVFKEMNFQGDVENYHDPQNSYMNTVMDRGKGIPISLALVVLFLARRLDLPFYGVNMPIHFMLNYNSGQHDLMIDPFDGGTVVTRNQCYQFLMKNGVRPKAEHFDKAGPKEILTRYLRNLLHNYARNQEENRVEQIQQLLDAAESMLQA